MKVSILGREFFIVHNAMPLEDEKPGFHVDFNAAKITIWYPPEPMIHDIIQCTAAAVIEASDCEFELRNLHPEQ